MSNTKQPFEWTDELVVKFFTDTYRSGFYDIPKHVSDFKASRSVGVGKKDWEITCMASASDPSYLFRLQPNGRFMCDRWDNEDFDLKEDLFENKIGKKYSIHSVRRLSDSIAFTIGDSVDIKIGSFTSKDGYQRHTTEITKFTIVHGEMFVEGICCSGSLTNAISLENYKTKAPTPEPKPGCGICGGETILIRGRYPGCDKRRVCPTCATERLEQINSISSEPHGQPAQSKINKEGDTQ